MNDSRALKIRVLKYLIPVTIICIVFNITKFFEIEIIYVPIQPVINATVSSAAVVNQSLAAVISEAEMSEDESVFPLENITTLDTAEGEATQYRVALNITEFRMNPVYSINFNWFRFISIGVIPFLLLVYFNTQIYLDIRKQRRRKRAAKAKKFATSTATAAATMATAAVPESRLNPGGHWKKLQRRLMPGKKDHQPCLEAEVVQMLDCTESSNEKIHQEDKQTSVVSAAAQDQSRLLGPRRAVVRTKVEDTNGASMVRFTSPLHFSPTNFDFIRARTKY